MQFCMVRCEGCGGGVGGVGLKSAYMRMLFHVVPKPQHFLSNAKALL